jgi:hypothetical protein
MPLEIMQEPTGLKVGVSISRKINLGNYESAEVWVSLTGIEAGTTQEEMQAALTTGALAYDVLKVAVGEKVKDQRKKAE